jgi:DNA-binding CsgD family transcriptional regulator
MPALAQAEGMLAAFDATGVGAVLVDLQGFVLATNQKAKTHIGSEIEIVGGRLTCEDRAASVQLERLGKSAVRGNGRDGDPILLPRDGRVPLLVYEVPLPKRTRVRGATKMILLLDPSRAAAPSAAILRNAFGLTPTEVDVAQQIATGRDLTEIAQKRGVSLGTLRVQLRSIFSKTSTNRQGQLVALLAGLTAGLAI